MNTVTFMLPPHKAIALAQFVKRIAWTEIRLNALDDAEAQDMRDAIESLRCGLSDAGFAPR